ncbi:MAG: hypothetical protein KBS75_00170 [Bacteroidales bacterium]|nr:hypothetical protein [Candidatus Equimonas faecalis]
MNWIEFIKTNWQYIVPVIGFLCAVFMYVAHDRKLKNLQIKQLKEEQDKKKQANIKCNAYRSKSNSIVKIINAGPSDASNVRVEIIDQDKLEGLIFFHGKWGPYDLINATNSVEDRIALCCGHTEHIKLKIVWDDDFSKNRETILNIQLS